MFTIEETKCYSGCKSWRYFKRTILTFTSQETYRSVSRKKMDFPTFDCLLVVFPLYTRPADPITLFSVYFPGCALCLWSTQSGRSPVRAEIGYTTLLPGESLNPLRVHCSLQSCLSSVMLGVVATLHTSCLLGAMVRCLQTRASSVRSLTTAMGVLEWQCPQAPLFSHTPWGNFSSPSHPYPCLCTKR